MAKGWESIHPLMVDALKSIGVGEEDILQGYGALQVLEGDHMPEGEIDGHPFSSCVDLPLKMRTPKMLAGLVRVGFAPLVYETPPAGPRIHCVYVGARDQRGVVTIRPWPRIQIMRFIQGLPPSMQPLSKYPPTADERESIRARYAAWVPDPDTRVIGPDGKPIPCCPFYEPGKPDVLRCSPRAILSLFGITLWGNGDEMTLADGSRVALRNVDCCQLSPGLERADLVPLAEALGLHADVQTSPEGATLVRLTGEAIGTRPARPRVRKSEAGPLPDDEFASVYRELVERLFRRLRTSDGISEADLDTAEQRLGVKLPQRLRAVYRLCGAFEKLHQEHHTLVLPEDLSIEGSALVFYCESQGTLMWGVRVGDLHQDDPPVYQSETDGEPNWLPDHPSLSAFFTTMTYLQASEVGLPRVAVEEISGETAERIAQLWPLVSDGGHQANGLRIYGEGTQVLCVYLGNETHNLQAAAKTKAELKSIGNRLGIQLVEC